MRKKYFTEEERQAAKIERGRRWYQKNKEKIVEQKAEYQSTPKGRAVNLVGTYRRADKDANRGECTITAEWIVEHIFTQPCAHCGKAGWKIIGCNRLDDSLPHTPDNVEPCCWECNTKLEIESQKKVVYQYTKDGKLVKVWESTMECGRNGFNHCHVSSCCNGKRKTHKGCIWSYVPL